MTTPISTTSSPKPPGSYACGDRIRVTRGALAGQRGKVAWVRDRNHCALTIDGMQEGVYVIVSCQSLELHEE